MFDQEYVTFSPKIRQSSITHLKCSGCGEIYAHDSVQKLLHEPALPGNFAGRI